MSFIMKRMHVSGSLGDDLRELRERVNMNVDEASRHTKVVPSMIRLWEQGAWSSFGDEAAYLERMLRGYIRAFGGRESFYLDKFHQELKVLGIKTVKTQIHEMRPFRGLDLFWTMRARVALFLSIFVFGLGFYMVAQARSLAEPPTIEIASPQDGQKLDRPIVHVKGKTAPEAFVFVNDQQATIHQDGTFDLDVEVPRGSTELRIRVNKRHSREAVITRRIVYERTTEQVQEL